MEGLFSCLGVNNHCVLLSTFHCFYRRNKLNFHLCNYLRIISRKELDSEKIANEKLRKQLEKIHKTRNVQDQNEHMVHAFRRLSANDNTQNHPQGDHFMTSYGFLSPTFQLIASPLTTAANMTNSPTVFPYPENDASQGEQTKPTYTQLLG